MKDDCKIMIEKLIFKICFMVNYDGVKWSEKLALGFGVSSRMLAPDPVEIWTEKIMVGV